MTHNPDSRQDHGSDEQRAYLAVERSAVIAAARRFLAAHDKVIGSNPVRRDGTFDMKDRADELRAVLALHDENLALVEAARSPAGRTPCPICPHWMELHNDDGTCGCGAHG